MGGNCVGKLCKNPIHFVRMFNVRMFFLPKILKISWALSKLFMHMKTHFSSISFIRDLSLCEFLRWATLVHISPQLPVWHCICLNTPECYSSWLPLHQEIWQGSLPICFQTFAFYIFYLWVWNQNERVFHIDNDLIYNREESECIYEGKIWVNNFITFALVVLLEKY